MLAALAHHDLDTPVLRAALRSSEPSGLAFGVRLEPPTRRLLRGGEAVSLTPKAFDTLLALVERHDRVVDKAELMRIVWPDSFVEEANLSQTIFVLRKTLGDVRPLRADPRFASLLRRMGLPG